MLDRCRSLFGVRHGQLYHHRLSYFSIPYANVKRPTASASLHQLTRQNDSHQLFNPNLGPKSFLQFFLTESNSHS